MYNTKKTLFENVVALYQNVKTQGLAMLELQNLFTSKADKTTTDELTTVVLLKADKTYTDAQLLLKADKTYTDAQLLLKADKTYTDAQLTGKAPAVHAHDDIYFTETEVTNALALKANKTQEAWITPTLLNGWTEVSGYPVRYRINQLGKVEFKGRVQSGVAGTQMIAMPFGYRALTNIEKVQAHGVATSFIKVLFQQSNSSLYIMNSYTTYVDLSGFDYFTN